MPDDNDLYVFQPLREVVKQHQLFTKKKFGQHFLFDENITDKIVRCAGDVRKGTIFEIGPGPGGLTRSLLRAKAQNIVAIEYDSRCVKALDYLSHPFSRRLAVIECDALKYNEYSCYEGPLKVIANLPYNISVPLLILWVKQIELFESLTLMFQKEVVDRIVAPVGTKSYGRLSVICQFYCEAHKIFDIPASAFVPPPKVISSVVQLKVKNNQHKFSFYKIEKVVAAAFNQRRKMIKKSLRPLFQDINDILNSLSINPDLRAEQLTPEQYAMIADLLP